MNPRDELTDKEFRTVRFIEDQPAQEAARRRRRAVGHARDQMEHDDTVEVKHE